MTDDRRLMTAFFFRTWFLGLGIPACRLPAGRQGRQGGVLYLDFSLKSFSAINSVFSCLIYNFVSTLKSEFL